MTTALPPRRRPAAHRRLLLGLALACATLLASLAWAAPAAAHASLVGTDPAEGSVVDRAPEDVSLTFSEDVALSGDGVRVLDPNGDRADSGRVTESAPRTFDVALTPGIPDGTYTVAWQAVSADSHPIAGAFTFSIGAPSETSVSLAQQQPGTGPVGLLYDIARYAAYAGFVLLVGGVAFVLTCWSGGAGAQPVRRVVVTGWVTLLVATLALLLLCAPYTTGGGLADVLDLGGVRAVLDTKTGAALVSRLLLLGAASLFVAVLFGSYARLRTGSEEQEREERPEERTAREAQAEKDRRDLRYGLALGGGVVAVGLAATWALSEHASTGIQTGVAIPVDIVHLLCVAAWLGGLAALAATLRWGPPVPRAAVAAFSRLAFASVVLLVVTGLYQSWRQVGGWSALTSTDYGRLLLLKVVLVAVLVGVAAGSRRWTARLGDAPPEPADGAEADAEVEVGAEAGAGAEDTARDDGGPPPDAVSPERAAQLARQRAAVATARRRRARDADAPRAALRRSVLAEAGIAVVLLAVTTGLTGTEPARTAAGGTAPGAAGSVAVSVPFDTGGPDGAGTAEVELDPGGPGENTLTVDTDVPAVEVRVALTLPSRDIGPLTVTPEASDGTGLRWSAPDVQVPVEGEWEIAVTVRTSDVDQVTEKKTVTIGRSDTHEHT
ncbi:copper resistance CopC/CopD family protein [Streptomyces chumphonensis]|uniref:copper resistance CopC/CopD family protein n=1 Tax=Streptomyces chumphonensis TaxID=1214925 RepID=UPI003D737F60